MSKTVLWKRSPLAEQPITPFSVMLSRLFSSTCKLCHSNCVRFGTRKMSVKLASNVYVRSLEKKEQFSITFAYDPLGVGERWFTLNRGKDEPISLVFSRIASNVTKHLDKKLKRKRKKNETNADLDDNLEIRLIHGGKVLGNDSLNSVAWIEGAVLKINETELTVKVNPPTITQLKLPKVIMAGFLVYPAIEFEFVEPEEIKYVWYKRRLSREKHKRRGSQSSQSGDEPETDEIKPVGFGGWIKASEAFAYDVTDDDIGRNLKLVCTPARKDQTGLEVSVESLNAVVAGPEKCLFEARHLHTKNITTGDELRVVTYNVLADLYADQDYTREVLHSYCPAEALSFEYRRPLLLKEIAGYNSDLLCLQEVDAKAFDRDYKPFFAMNGMDGVFCKKGGEVAEGVAVFFRKNRFRLVTYKSTIISELLKRDSQFAGLSQKIGKNARLYARFMSRFSSFQLVLLEDITNPKRAILVGNTHLYFHPDADHIRLIQSSICFNHLEYVLTDLKEEYSYDIIAPIFCGDFNSCPEFAVYKLATTGRVDDKCEDWRSNSEEVAENVVVEHGLKLASACGLPEYTNYVGGFNGCLDYIFFDTTSFTAESFVPYPPHEEVIRHTALPSIVCPSDHIASIATLKWTV